MPELKAYNINSWPDGWREKGELARQRLAANPGLSINSPEYHEYMDYCLKCVLFKQEHSPENDGGE